MKEISFLLELNENDVRKMILKWAISWGGNGGDGDMREGSEK